MSSQLYIILESAFNKESSLNDRLKDLNNLKEHINNKDVQKKILENYFEEDVEIRRTLINLLFQSGYTIEYTDLSKEYKDFFEKMIYKEPEEDLRITAFLRYCDDVNESDYFDDVMLALFLYDNNLSLKTTALSFLSSHKLDSKAVDEIEGFALNYVLDSLRASLLIFFSQYEKSRYQRVFLHFLDESYKKEDFNLLFSLLNTYGEIEPDFIKGLIGKVKERQNLDLSLSFYQFLISRNAVDERTILDVLEDLKFHKEYGFIIQNFSNNKNFEPQVIKVLESIYFEEKNIAEKARLLNYFSTHYSSRVIESFFDPDNALIKSNILLAVKNWLDKIDDELQKRFILEIENEKQQVTLFGLLQIFSSSKLKSEFSVSVLKRFLKEDKFYLKRAFYSTVMNLKFFKEESELFFKAYLELLSDDSLVLDVTPFCVHLKELDLSESKNVEPLFLKIIEVNRRREPLKYIDELFKKYNFKSNLENKLMLCERFSESLDVQPLRAWIEDIGKSLDDHPEYNKRYKELIKGSENIKTTEHLSSENKKELFLSQFSKLMEEKGMKGFMDLEKYIDDSFANKTIKKSDAVKIVVNAMDWHTDYPGVDNLLRKFNENGLLIKEVAEKGLVHIAQRGSNISHTLARYVSDYLKEHKEFDIVENVVTQENYTQYFRSTIRSIKYDNKSGWDMSASWWIVPTGWFLDNISELPDEKLFKFLKKPMSKKNPSFLQPQYYVLRMISKNRKLMQERFDDLMGFYNENKTEFDSYFIDRMQAVLWSYMHKNNAVKEEKKSFYKELHEEIKDKEAFKVQYPNLEI